MKNRKTLSEHEGIRFGKPKQTHLELNLVRDIRVNKKGFYRYINRKRRTEGNTGPLLNGIRGLSRPKDMEKAEVLKVFFILVFTSKTGLQESQVPETSVKVQSRQRTYLLSLWRRIRLRNI